MRIKSFRIENYEPIRRLSLENLGATVIIAGANGSGKTRLKQAIMQTIQGNPVMDMIIEATREEEKDEKYFGANTLEVVKGDKNEILNGYINSRKYGAGKYVGSVVQIDSHREISTAKLNPVNWLGGDPDDIESVSNFYFGPFSNRWQDFMNYIHQKAASRDKKLADELKLRPTQGENILEENPDPLEKYKKIFSDLLHGKKLLDIDPANPKEFQYEDESGTKLNFKTLSSGEQEVIKVLFDVARKEIRHSVIIVDEPELHLHPTLAFKLIESLKSIGEHTNQFIFLTHSADLISTYYSTGDVYFIDSTHNDENQAHKLSELNHSHRHVVELIGQNLGLFAVGKKLVFIEGENSSVDRMLYHTIAQEVNREIRVIPVGSVVNIMNLNQIEEQIRNSIFGINIFMLRDRDGLSEHQVSKLEENGRIKCLKRRHIENYFLDTEVLYWVAETFYLTGDINPTLTQSFIEAEMRRLAEGSLNFNLYKNMNEYLGVNYHFNIPSIRAVETKSIEDLKGEIIGEIGQSLSTLSGNLESGILKVWLDTEEVRLKEMLDNNTWKDNFQAKYIFSKICVEVLRVDALRVRKAYVDIALKKKREVLSDILDIFKQVSIE